MPMRTEARFLVAIVLMIVVLVGTNLLFPPVPPEPSPTPGDSVAGAPPAGPVEAGADSAPVLPELTPAPRADVTPDVAEEDVAPEPATPERRVVAESPLYRFEFTNRGARLVSARLTQFQSFTHTGAVELVPEESGGILGQKIVLGSDTLDLSSLAFEVAPEAGVTLQEGDTSRSLRFTYRHPTRPFLVELEYTFLPDTYLVTVTGRVEGVERAVLVTDLGPGLAVNEAREEDDVQALAFVTNHLSAGIEAYPFRKVRGLQVEDGPFHWVALKSKYFVSAMVAGDGGPQESYLGGVSASPAEVEDRADVVVSQAVRADGTFAYRLFMGPQDLPRMTAVGNDLENVNPYGWRFLQPVIRPFATLITNILLYLHRQLNWGYGWVLILFGVMMRVLLFPLNQRAMRAQLKNMAVQPLLKDIQTRYKDQPEKMQKELMRLHKEHGFNPLAGCLPMLLPWPVLITLFFVFQYTIELRGVPFLWLPDLSAPDPLYILPAFLGLSMFLLQWVSIRAVDDPNPQLKMMMWIMPIFMVLIFLNLASGLNLYYATANIATLPQQFWIAQERKKAKARGPVATPAS